MVDLLIKKIYKLLIVYEQFTYEQYHGYLENLTQFMAGVENPTKEMQEALIRLKGFLTLDETEVDHRLIKDVVLDSCNKLQRESLRG